MVKLFGKKFDIVPNNDNHNSYVLVEMGGDNLMMWVDKYGKLEISTVPEYKMAKKEGRVLFEPYEHVMKYSECHRDPVQHPKCPICKLPCNCLYFQGKQTAPNKPVTLLGYRVVLGCDHCVISSSDNKTVIDGRENYINNCPSCLLAYDTLYRRNGEAIGCNHCVERKDTI